jgi:hypothetical protein
MHGEQSRRPSPSNVTLFHQFRQPTVDPALRRVKRSRHRLRPAGPSSRTNSTDGMPIVSKIAYRYGVKKSGWTGGTVT